MFASMIERILHAPSVHTGVARGLVFVAVAMVVFALFDRVARAAIGARRRWCPKCRYSLDGLTVDDDRFLCPECGFRSTPTRTGRLERYDWQPRKRMLVMGVVLLVASAFSWWWFERTVQPPPLQATQQLPPPPFPPPPPPPLILGNPG